MALTDQTGPLVTKETTMTASVLVTGGTGSLGRALVPLLRAEGCDVRVLTRRPRPDEDGVRYLGGDLETGEGLAAALDGAEVVVHLAGNQTGDGETTATLVRAAQARPDPPHLVHISVVGAERVPVTSRIDRGMFGYFASKRAAELAVTGAELPWTMLRATQFHDLILTVAKGLAKPPVALVPGGGIRFQPVDTGVVAARLVDLALDKPAGLVRELGGPQALTAAEIVRAYLRATGRRRRPIVGVPAPGGAARAIGRGANLPVDGDLRSPTWQQYLAALPPQ
jgi:uncharacterized protein YbjT (DUF2867 family)